MESICIDRSEGIKTVCLFLQPGPFALHSTQNIFVTRFTLFLVSIHGKEVSKCTGI